MKYTALEVKLIGEAKEQGATNKAIANFLNKKVHHGRTVRTEDGIRKRGTK